MCVQMTLDDEAINELADEIADRVAARIDLTAQAADGYLALTYATRAGGLGNRPIIVNAVTLLPEPDSPTMPSISPCARSNDTSSTAVTSPRAV